jgi:hypothetical protein
VRKKRKPGTSKPASKPAESTPSEAPAPAPQATQAQARPAALDERVVTQLWIFGALGTVAVACAAGFGFGIASAVLVVLGGAFAAVIALFWSSLRTALGETPLASADAFAIGTRRAEEEQKRAVLRALKDLEFERGVGKISENDYRVLVTQYRQQAKHLLRAIDEQNAGNRKRAEDFVRERGIEPAALPPPEVATPTSVAAAYEPSDDAKNKPAKEAEESVDDE